MVIITKVFVINENVYHSLILLVWGYILICNMQELGHYNKIVSMSHFLRDCPKGKIYNRFINDLEYLLCKVILLSIFVNSGYAVCHNIKLSNMK